MAGGIDANIAAPQLVAGRIKRHLSRLACVSALWLMHASDAVTGLRARRGGNVGAQVDEAALHVRQQRSLAVTEPLFKPVCTCRAKRTVKLVNVPCRMSVAAATTAYAPSAWNTASVFARRSPEYSDDSPASCTKGGSRWWARR